MVTEVEQLLQSENRTLREKVRRLEQPHLTHSSAEGEDDLSDGVPDFCRQVFNTAAIVVWDAKTKQFVDVNDATLGLYGYTRSEFLALRYSDIDAELKNSDESYQQACSDDLSWLPLQHHRKRDGTIFPVEIATSAIKHGERMFYAGWVRDVTERVRMEKSPKNGEAPIRKSHDELVAQVKELTASLERSNSQVRRKAGTYQALESDQQGIASNLQAFFDAHPDLQIHLNADGTIIGFHAGEEGDTHLLPKELIGRRVQDVMPPTVASIYDDAIGHALDAHETVCVEYDLLSPNGQAYFEGRVVPREPDEVIIIVRNISQRKRAELLLQAVVEGTASATGEDFFPSFARAVASVFDVRYVLVCEHLNAPASRVRTHAFWMSDHLGSNIEYDLEGGPCEATAMGEMTYFPRGLQELFPADKDLVDLEAESYCGVPLIDSTGRLIGHLAIMDDRPMTTNVCDVPALSAFVARAAAELERTITERALRRSERRLKTIIAAAPLVITSVTPDGEIDVFDGQALESLGFKPGQFAGQNYFELWRDRPHLVTAMRACLAGRTPPTEKTIVTDRVLETRYATVRSSAGETAGAITVCIDVTAQNRAEAELRASHNLLMAVIEGTTDSIFVKDIGGRYVMVNSRACEIIGKPESEVIGKGDKSLFSPEVSQAIVQADQHVRDYGNTISLEEMLPSASDESPRIFLSTKAPYRDHEGKIVGVVGISRDITDRKAAEEAVRDSEQRFRSIFEQAGLAVGLLDSQSGRFLRVNRKYEELLGYTGDELLKMTWMEVTYPDDVQTDLDNMEELVDRQISEFTMEKRLVHKDGTVIWINLTVSPVGDDGEAPNQHIAIIQDITKRKRAERAVRDSEQRLRIITDTLPAFISYADADRRFRFVNRQYEKHFGVRQEDILGKHLSDILGETYYQGIAQHLDATLAGNHVKYESKMEVEGGDYQSLACEHVPDFSSDGQVIGFYTLATDISDRTAAEDAVRASEQRLRLVTDALPALVSYIGADQRYQFVNKFYSEAFGIEQDRLIGQHVRDVLGEKEFDEILPHMELALAGKRVRYETTIDFERLGKRSLLAEYTPDVSVDGEIRGYYALITDNTERKQAERALMQMNIALTNATPGISRLSAEGRYLNVNEAYAEMVGYEIEELVGMDWKPTVHLDDLATVTAAYEQMLVEGKAEAEVVGVRKDGSNFHKHVVLAKANENDASAGHYCFMRDITERKTMSEQLQCQRDELAHITRLSTMGEMATALAHELNQPLTAVANYAFAVETELNRGQDVAQIKQSIVRSLDKMKVQAVRAGEIVRRMRNFLRKMESHRTPTDINELVREVVALTEPEARQRSTQIRLDLDHDLPQTCIDNIQIQQVLVNLIRNAFDAMNDIAASERKIAITTFNKGRGSIEVAVQDCGSGIAEELTGKLFDTFFTTKPTGMGMGLSISRSIVEEHNGRLWVDTESPVGTRFRFQLPIATDGGDENGA